jgi:hypothetical protein
MGEAFDRVAEAFDEARGSYPASLIDRAAEVAA